MKKIITTVIALIICLSMFVGCGSNAKGYIESKDCRFVVIDNDVSTEEFDNGHISKSYFIADTETGVVYVYFDGYRRGAITALLNSDGTPMLYDFEHKKIIESGDK